MKSKMLVLGLLLLNVDLFSVTDKDIIINQIRTKIANNRSASWRNPNYIEVQYSGFKPFVKRINYWESHSASIDDLDLPKFNQASYSDLVKLEQGFEYSQQHPYLFRAQEIISVCCPCFKNKDNK
jgi:hypothetical protein